jgi:hypothetical protein
MEDQVLSKALHGEVRSYDGRNSRIQELLQPIRMLKLTTIGGGKLWINKQRLVRKVCSHAAYRSLQ